MDELMKSWAHLQSKRGRLKREMGDLLAYLHKAMDHEFYYEIILRDRFIDDFHEEETKIIINCPGNMGTLELEFLTRETLQVVLGQLRTITRNESPDSGNSMPSLTDP